MAVGLRQHHARGLGVSGSRLLEIGQRRQARGQPCQLALARPQIVRLPFELDARGRQLGLARGPRVQRRLGRLLRAAQPVGGRRAIALRAAPAPSGLRILPSPSFASSSETRCAGFFGVLNRMSQRRRDVQRREHLRPRRLDVGFEPLDAPILVAVFRFDPLQLGGGLLLVLLRLRGGLRALGQQEPSGLAARLERRKLRAHFFGARAERRDLLAVELDLLLAPVDVELAGVHGLARARRLAFGLDERDADAAEIRFRCGHRRRRGRLALARVRQPAAQRFDFLRRLLITAGEQQLLPVAQLVAQPLVPARLRRLALERSELLLELEDDVFQAGQVLRARPRASARPRGAAPCTW